MNQASKGLLALVLASCTPTSDVASLASDAAARRPIINGNLESGFPAVGALVGFQGNQYFGAFCSGTLIDSRWVLTAAHCLEDTFGETAFYVGSNANDPDADDIYVADLLWPHPDYEGLDGFDIALVRLAEAPSGVTPIPFNQQALTSAMEGDDVFYVGFGTDEGYNEGDSGVKRSTTLTLDDVRSNTYVTDNTPKGVCSGDSGGPGLFDFGVGLTVIGVNSYVSAGRGSDACFGDSVQTRVDIYADWILGVMDGTLTDCNNEPTICACADACLPSGECDDSACGIDDCASLYDCVSDCDTNNCAAGCYERARTADQNALDDLFVCIEDNCSTATTRQAFQNCVATDCGTEYAACFEGGGGGGNTEGPLLCGEVYECLLDCETEQCQLDCYNAGSSVAQGRIDDMLDCWEARCGDETTENGFTACVQDECATEMGDCGDANECDLAGGDCGNGEACAERESDEARVCFPSDEKKEGASCADDASLACADGLFCDDGKCVAFDDDGGSNNGNNNGGGGGSGAPISNKAPSNGCSAAPELMPLWGLALLLVRVSRLRRKRD